MINFKEYLILEGVDDQGIFKAVFLAGGPGSGKSFVARNTLPNAAFGLKMVNSDEALETLLKKHSIPSNMNAMTQADMDKFKYARDKAKNLTAKRENLYLQGRLGLILDGTGKDYDKIRKKRDELAALGYDTYMIFVNTSLDVALERNANRDRSVSNELVKTYWQEVQQNIGKFQNLFGSNNFAIVDNNRANEDVLTKVFKGVRKFTERPLHSHIAKDWVAKMKKNK